jgi:hypothetical protein
MTVLYIIIAVVVGWFIGFLDSNIRTAQKIKAAELKAEVALKDAETRIAQAQKNPQVQQDNPGLLRLKKDAGKFSLELDGALVGDMLSPDKKKRLIELVTVLRPWLEAGQSQAAVSQPAAAVPAARPLDSAQEVIYAPVQSSTQPLPPIAKKPEAEKNIASLSIVAQIDTVLQARLVDTPLAKKGIRLQDSPQGGVEVYVGLDKFLSVDDVPDEIIKATIRAAITEWEDKYTPGF